MKIGITGSISSGKSSVAKILCNNKNLLFSADKVVQSFYKSIKFKKKITRKFKIKDRNIKRQIKRELLSGKISLGSLGKLIHPLVRKEMRAFYKRNKNKNTLFFEIPLLIENNLTSFFDFIILVVSPKKLRLKRYQKNGGEKKMFYLLDKGQMSAKNKIKYSDYLIVNNSSKSILKKKVNDIMK